MQIMHNSIEITASVDGARALQGGRNNNNNEGGVEAKYSVPRRVHIG